VLDGRHLGLNTHVMLDRCRGIELEPGDIDRALDEMKRAGAVLLKNSEL
jgi:nicotinamidase/pyrazinamidase